MFQETKGVVAAGKSVAEAGTTSAAASPAIITTTAINRRNKEFLPVSHIQRIGNNRSLVTSWLLKVRLDHS
ncbi:hypothetical protein [Streptomyces viridosporus]|uniref:hypothetical protein n=1 Tax=Streptomyces viridosporus TaxID=67581 RepID=UPI001357A303|nr:hypothetical protein [Streptomyces viridosporus]